MPINGITYDRESLSISVEGIGQISTLSSFRANGGRNIRIKPNTQGYPARKVRGAYEGGATLELAAVEAMLALNAFEGEGGVLGADIVVSLTYGNADQEDKNDKYYLTVNDWQEDSPDEDDEAMTTVECVHNKPAEINGKPLMEQPRN